MSFEKRLIWFPFVRKAPDQGGVQCQNQALRHFDQSGGLANKSPPAIAINPKKLVECHTSSIKAEH